MFLLPVCLLQPDDTVNVAVEKINALLETFLGISDTELGKVSKLVINRMAYYISQGRVETPSGRGGQFCCSFVANLLQYLFAKNYQNTSEFDKAISVQFLSCVSLLTHNINIANLSVCLSICTSVTFRYQTIR